MDPLTRTGGEKRLSDFFCGSPPMLHFTDLVWPDFDEADLEAAVKEFGRWELHFGGIPEATAFLLGGVQ